jgi:plastocyanin
MHSISPRLLVERAVDLRQGDVKPGWPCRRGKEHNVTLRRMVGPLLAAALFGLVSLSPGGVDAQARTLSLKAGGGADGNWVNLFLPATVTLQTGDTLSWRLESGEPHSITFILGDPPAGGLPVTPSPVTIPDDGPVINSDLIFGGNPTNPPTFEATFSAPGNYDYFCIIHPFMTGTVEVLDPGDPGSARVDNQASLDARGAADENSAIIEGQQNDAAIRVRIPGAIAKPGGSREFAVILGGETRNTQQNIMYPSTLTVRPGDSVRFINETPVPHSATFGQLPPGDPFAAPATANSDPANGVVHTGLFTASGDPPALTPESKVVSFSKPGSYDYYCLLHPEMRGTIVVSAAAPQPPNTGSGLESHNHEGTAGAYLVGAVATVAVVATGSVAFANSRRKVRLPTSGR